MRRYAFITVDVFTDQRFGGNPLAVFPDARGMSDAEMQSLAAEFNLSETTFVLPPEDPANTARVRIFTRTREMPFAGHPNVGTGYVLGHEKPSWQEAAPEVLRFEEPAGLVEVTLTRAATGTVTGSSIAAPQPLSLGAPVPLPLLAAAAGLGPADFITFGHAPLPASVGNPFVLAQVRGDALGRAAPDLAGFRAMLEAVPELEGRFALYLYATAGERLRARMFAPLGGTIEDAATGSAAAPLAALLLSLSTAESGAWDILQGAEMGRPSLLRAKARRGADGIRAQVGGGCVPVLRGEALL